MCSKSTEEREDLDGDKENLLEGEIPPGIELPETFPFSLRNLDTDPFLRIQVPYIVHSDTPIFIELPETFPCSLRNLDTEVHRQND